MVSSLEEAPGAVTMARQVAGRGCGANESQACVWYSVLLPMGIE